jgi:hypothetical protein
MPRPLPESFFSDAPEKVRIEIERDGAATVAAHFAGGPVSFLCPLPLNFFLGPCFFGFLLGGMN